MTLTAGTLTGTAQIDRWAALPATLAVEQHNEQHRTAQPKADLRWELTDDAGHWHTYDEGGDLPTLESWSEHIPCDGSCGDGCGGYHAGHWRCRICGQDVEPGVTTGEHSFTVPGPSSWSVEMTGSPAKGMLDLGTATVRFTAADGRVLFGVVLVGEVASTDGRFTIQLLGTGPLGQQKQAP